MPEYTIIIEKAKGNYSAYCPDLPGCIATGSTIEETIMMMRVALALHIEELKEEELTIPEPFTKAVSIEVAV